MVPMTPTLPAYIPATLQGSPVDFAWQGALSHVGPEGAVTPLLKKLDGLTTCGQLSLCAGLLTWAAWRLRDETDEALSALELAEAVFAHQVDWRYVNRDAGHVRAVPEGPPALSALLQVSLFMWEGLSVDWFWDSYYAPITQTFHAAHIVQHIMPNTHRPAMVRWLGAAIQRLQVHARAPDEPFRKQRSFPSLDEWKVFVGRHRGPPLPPGIIDLQADYQPAQRQALVTRFIEGLDWERNRFLRSPQAMLALGFQGEPYRGPIVHGDTA
jgi:hypothetical protein